MSKQDGELYLKLAKSLENYEQSKRPLSGISSDAKRDCLIRQMIDSMHRVRYPAVIRTRPLCNECADPSSILFDPLKAAIVKERVGEVDDAFWLVFLSTHFGKHREAGWRYSREVYGRLGQGGFWDWASISSDPEAFKQWLDGNIELLRRPGGFGNHRKYQSLEAYSPNGTGNAVCTYVNWVGPLRGHQQMLKDALAASNDDPKRTFEYLYNSMSSVVGFGRTARFDYLTMLGKIGLAQITPGSPYLRNSTGPTKGAKLLFGNASISTLEGWILELDSFLGIGMQAMEDSICNWQKSPGRFQRFRG